MALIKSSSSSCRPVISPLKTLLKDNTIIKTACNYAQPSPSILKERDWRKPK